MDNTNKNNHNIVLDPSSGISIEEQKEILSHINGIAEENRKKLTGEQQEEKTNVINAKKKGVFFPVIVNIAALVIICLGLILLLMFNNRADSQVRTGNAVYNLTERALIEEIRKSTAEQISAKEMEIFAITSRMEGIDNELSELYSSNITLTSEQIAARERLLQMQNSFRNELSVLNEERSQILEASRISEARLRAQLDERTREFAAAQQQVSGELETAVNQLEQMAREQERLTAIDAHFSGSIASISDMIQKGQYDQAAQTTVNLRDFINVTLPVSSRNPRREYYIQAVNLMEVLITDARRNSASGIASGQAELQTRNTQLQNTINEMQRTIDSFNSGSSGQARRIVELEESITSLRNSNTSLTQSSAEKDQTISSLQSERTALSSTVTELRATNTVHEQEIANLRNQITVIRQLLQENN